MGEGKKGFVMGEAERNINRAKSAAQMIEESVKKKAGQIINPPNPLPLYC